MVFAVPFSFPSFPFRFPHLIRSPRPSRQIAELQQAAAANNKSELEALLDAVRQEKNRVDERAARLQEALSRSQCEKTALEEQVATLQQENKVRVGWWVVLVVRGEVWDESRGLLCCCGVLCGPAGLSVV